MVTDTQVRRLRRLLTAGKTLTVAAARTDMDDKTARKYRRQQQLPSELARPHDVADQPVVYLRSSQISKEEEAAKIAARDGVRDGLICRLPDRRADPAGAGCTAGE